MFNFKPLFMIFLFMQLSNRFTEGGPVMMSLILICLLLSLFFLSKGFMDLTRNPMNSKKMIRLVADVSLLGLVLGFFGSILGLISAFDSVESISSVNTEALASGLKTSFLTTLFGAFVFIISRVGILVLKSLHKE